MLGLPPPPRRYLPAAVRVDRLADLEACYGELAARPLPDADLWALEQWLVDWSELESHLAEDQARKQITMCRRTDDLEAERAYLEIVDVLAPRCKPLRDVLTRRLVAHPAAARLPAATHACALRTLRARAALFRRELVPLEAAEQHLRAEYQRLRGGMSIAWDGRPRPLEVVERDQDDPDRARREAAWRAVAARYLAEKPAFDELFDRLLANRRAQAAAAGQPDYRAFRFRQLGRFDYGPTECAALHAAIETEVVPLAAAILARRAAALGLARVRPWDLAAPLADAGPPFTREEELIAGCARAFEALDPELGRQFAGLAGHGLLDLMSRPGKAAGGFQANLEASRQPFIFTNAVGRHDDVFTLLHEAGHAFHALAGASDPLIWSRSPPIEFCELASLAMELLAGSHLHAFYDDLERPRALRRQLEQLVLFLPFCAALDAFQHWVYTAPEAADPAARDATWLALHGRLHPAVDWSGLEDIRAAGWQRKLHVFEVPFYYIEYAIAGLGAIQLYGRYLADPRATMADYRRALALGGRAPLPELFAAAGVPWGLSAGDVRRATQVCRTLLEL